MDAGVPLTENRSRANSRRASQTALTRQPKRFQYVLQLKQKNGLGLFLKAPLGTSLPALDVFVNGEFCLQLPAHNFNILAGFLGKSQIEFDLRNAQELTVRVERGRDRPGQPIRPDTMSLV